jgi:hypothetical protein
MALSRKLPGLMQHYARTTWATPLASIRDVGFPLVPALGGWDG